MNLFWGNFDSVNYLSCPLLGKSVHITEVCYIKYTAVTKLTNMKDSKNTIHAQKRALATDFISQSFQKTVNQEKSARNR